MVSIVILQKSTRRECVTICHSSGPTSCWYHPAHPQDLLLEACLEWAVFSLGATVNLCLCEGMCGDV